MDLEGFDRNCYETPDWLFQALNSEFRFEWDLCALKETAKCANFFSPEEDSLKQEWHKLPGFLWLNPPYSPLKPWLEKAQAEARLGAKIVCLVPPLVCTAYLNKYLPDEIRFIVGRVSFLANKTEMKGNRDDSSVFIFDASRRIPRVVWINRDQIR